MVSVEGEGAERLQTPHWIVVDVPGELISEKLKLVTARIDHHKQESSLRLIAIC